MHWPQTKMSLVTTAIYCKISQSLSGVIQDCSIVRVKQLQMLYYRRCCMSPSQHVRQNEGHKGM